MNLLLTKVSREAKFCSVGCCTRNGSENAELHSFNSSPSKAVSVAGVEQGQLVEGADHGVDLLPLGPRGPRHLLGGWLVQHGLRGGGLHGNLRLHVGLLFVSLIFVAIHHGHGEPAELLAVRGAVAVRMIVV